MQFDIILPGGVLQKGNFSLVMVIGKFEAWAVTKLLRSPLFNRAVNKAYRKINGLGPIEPQNGGGRTGPSAFEHFKEEVKDQFKVMFWLQKPKK